MDFVKVVEDSEIYNFPIHHFVYFYSKFWSFACSNSGSAKRVRASRRGAATSRPCAHVASASAPAPRRPRPHADRGRAPSPGSCAPQHLGTRASRVSLPSRRTCAVQAADQRSVRGSGRMHAGRGTSYHDTIFAADVMSTRAALFKHRPPLCRI
jgi:hypothetical protein